MLEKIREMLESIEGFENKIAYRAFPVGEAPQLPFICFQETGTDNFFADDTVYVAMSIIDIELYSRNRDVMSEELIEMKLKTNHIAWTKDIDYIDSEKCYMVTYTVEI